MLSNEGTRNLLSRPFAPGGYPQQQYQQPSTYFTGPNQQNQPQTMQQIQQQQSKGLASPALSRQYDVHNQSNLTKMLFDRLRP
jgi:hypothetical protein